MTTDNLLNEIGLIDDEIINEAADDSVQIKSRFRWVKWASVAAAVCLTITGALFTLQNVFRSNTPAGSIKYYQSKDLITITCTITSGGMGGGTQNFGHFFVKDFSELATANPTRNNVNTIKELPVFKNEKGLWSDYNYDISKIDSFIYFDKPAYEETRDYDIYGESHNTWNICFRKDTKLSIVDQLLDYTFHRVYYALYDLDENIEGFDAGWSRVMTQPTQPGVIYPIISLNKAKEKLRNGDFFCYGSENDVAKTADILSVELEYLTDEYQVYIQPFYKFTITDSGWDLSNVMECDNKAEYKSVSHIFVPAIVDKYLDITEPNFEFNK